MPTNGQEVEMQQAANQEQPAQKNDIKDEQPKAEEKKKRPMGMPSVGPGSLRLEHEYQVLFGGNGQDAAKEDSKSNQQAAQGSGNAASDMKIQLLEKEVALLKEQMAKVQAELQQLKAEQAQANEPELTHELLNKLRELNGGKDVSPKVKENLYKILADAKDGEAVLQQAMNEHEAGDPIYAGHYVQNIVAGKQITDIIKNADTLDVLTLLGEDGFPARWQEQMKLSPDVRFASDYFHDKEFFHQTLFTEEGSKQIIKSVDNSFGKLADAINAGKENPYETLNLASKIEAEELAIEAGLVSRPEEMQQSTQDKQPEIVLPQEQMLLEHLRALNGDKEVPEQVKNNLHQLLAESAKSRDMLRQALDSRKPGEMLYAGDLVPSIVAGKNMEDFIMDSTTPDILNAIGDKNFVSQWKRMSLLSTDVRFASGYMHDKEFFEQSIFTENGMQQLSRSMDQGLEKWEEHIQAGKDPEMLYKASEIEAEKLAIEAGLERSQASLEREQKLLEHLRKINGNKEVPEQVKNNLHQLMDESASSRGMLRQALDSRKPGEMLYAGDLVPSIVAGKNMEKFIMDSTTPEILDVIGNKDFVPQWKNMSRLSADVRFASDYMHDKEFFEQSIFTKNGLRQLSRSMDQGLEKWDDHIQAGKDPEMLYKASEIEAEKLAIEAGLERSQASLSQEEKLLEHLRKINGNKEVPEQVKNNLHQLMDESAQSRGMLRQALNGRKPGEMLYAGDLVPSIVAGKNMEKFIMDSTTPEILDVIGNKDFVPQWKNMSRLSADVRFASDYMHDKEFFEQSIFTKNGMRQLSRSMDQGLEKWDDHIQAGKDPEVLYKASEIEAEKLAIEAGLVSKPEQVSKSGQVSKSEQTKQSVKEQQPKPKAQNEEELLQFLQTENKGKELPQAVKDNIHQVLADGEKSREILKNGVKAMKNGERVWAGDGTIESVVAADALKQMIQNRGEPFTTYLGGFDNFMNLLGGKDFPKGWKNLTGISENVRYAANFEHNKDFFEKNVLEPDGLQRLTQSISDKFPVYLQKAATKQDSELYKEAQKGAFQRDYIANQQKKDKPKQEKQKKQQKKPAAKENVQSNVQSNAPSIS